MKIGKHVNGNINQYIQYFVYTPIHQCVMHLKPKSPPHFIFSLHTCTVIMNIAKIKWYEK